MSRYDLGGEGEEAFEPGSEGRVLRNKLGITDPVEMGHAETQALATAIDRGIDLFESSTQFSVAILCDMHRLWLGEIYDFAGQIRTVNVSKGGVLFAPAAYLESTLHALDQVLLSNTPCEVFAQETLVQSVALVHGEFILAHPFREGNGRLGRWLADLMVMQAGFRRLRWGFDSKQEEQQAQYFAALRRAFAQDYSDLERLILSALKES